MTVLTAKNSDAQIRLNCALSLALATQDFEAIQFITLEKKRFEPIPKKTCLDCGVVISGPSQRCLMHDNAQRRGRKRK